MSRDPHPAAPGLAVGVDEAMIEHLVHTFYARVRADALLGPIFTTAIIDWASHLLKLCDFWSSVTLMTGRFKGTPIQAHTALPAITGEHFDHWLALFARTARDICPPAAAALFIDRSQRIAQSLELGVALHRKQILRSGERLRRSCPVDSAT